MVKINSCLVSKCLVSSRPMYYIYTLSIKGQVFYVGCSANPVARYKTHYHDTCSKCYDLARFWLKEKDVAMSMTIIDSAKDKMTAFSLESKYIEKYNVIHPILNNQHWPHLYTTAIARIDKLKTSHKIQGELDNIKKQILNYGK